MSGLCVIRRRLLWSSQLDPLPAWSADFRSLTLGDPGTLPGGLSFARTGGGRSVQTSATTIMQEAGKTFASSNGPRCGQPRGSASKGLCLEHSLYENCAAINNYADGKNVASDLRDISNATDWSNGGVGVTYATGTGSPDGVATAHQLTVSSIGCAQTRLQLNAKGGSSANESYASMTATSWQKGTGASRQVFAASNGAYSTVTTLHTLAGVWARIASTLTGLGTGYNVGRFCRHVDARDIYSDGGGARAIAAEVDLVQIEPGLHPTNWCPPGGASRARGTEFLWHPTRTTQILSGRLCVELTFAPHGAATEYTYQIDGSLVAVTQIHLWWVDASNRGWFDPATRKITTRINAVDYVHNTALSWSRGDTIQVWLEVGNGTPRASYRVSSDDESTWGAAVALGTGSAQAALPGGAGTLDFLCRSAATDVFTGYVKAIRVFDNTRPGWAS